MLVSVVIPNYNHFLYLKQRIDTVLSQTYDNFEVIILDDLSTDNSRQIIESYRGVHKISVIHYNDINSGSPFIQWAKGLEHAKGEYVWIAESDDWCEVNFLEEIMSYVRQYPAANLLYCNTVLIKGSEFLMPINVNHKDFEYYDENELLKKKLLHGLSINNASAVVFKKEPALLYIQELRWYQKHGDYFFWIQIAKTGSAIFINKPLNFCRILESSVTRQAWHKEVRSLIEHIQIFKLLNQCIASLSIRQKMYFFDSWGLSFMHMFTCIKTKRKKKYYFSLMHASRFNIYFSLRVLYFITRKKLII